VERTEYLNAENWRGSYYEFALDLGLPGDDALVLLALQAMWRQPQLRGPWPQRERFDSAPDDLAPPSEQNPLIHYGRLVLDDGTEVGCVSGLLRVDGEADWLSLSVPTGMLELRFPVSYPLETATNAWLVGLDQMLARIAGTIYETVPFQVGRLGEEAAAVGTVAAALTAEECERGGVLVPEQLWRRLNPRRSAECIVPGLVYAPLLSPQVASGG